MKNTIIVKHSDAHVCTDCLMWIANNDDSGASDDWTPPLFIGYPARVQCVPGDSEQDNEFSTATCDACGSHLAGARHHCVMLETIDTGELDRGSVHQFGRAYVECAQWSSTDTDPRTGDDIPLDTFTLTDETRVALMDQAARFCSQWHALVASAARCYGIKQAGHDFWLTRNGHGAGFWDGDLPSDLGDALTHAAKDCGECNLALGDDGEIYVY